MALPWRTWPIARPLLPVGSVCHHTLGLNTYVAQSRARYVTWTVVAEASVREAVKRGRALGDASPITAEHL